MYTIVTICPHCSSSQLADGHLLGKKVVCSKCKRDFVCKKKFGPVQWVREAKDGVSNCGFEKVVSRVLFTYGIAVPSQNQNTVLAHMGNRMSLGMTRDVVIHIGLDRYSASMAYFEGKGGEPKLHFKWKMEDSIALAIKRMMPRAYAHFVINRSKDFLPDMSVVISPAENIAEFNLQIHNPRGEELVEDGVTKLGRINAAKAPTIHKGEVKDLLHELGNV